MSVFDAEQTVVFSGGADATGVRPVLDALDARSSPYRLVDTVADSVMLTVTDGDQTLVSVGPSEFAIGPTSRVLLWRATSPSAATRSSSDPEIVRYVQKTEQVAWTSMLERPAIWVNRDSSRRSVEHDKIRQAEAARLCGLRTIPTTLTNSPCAFEAVVNRLGGDIAVKSPVSWHGSANDSGSVRATYTRRLTSSEAIEMASMVVGAPVYVQPYVEKLYELRVTVVGRSVFACRIDSQASSISKTDWRQYDLDNVAHDPIQLDLELRTALVRLVASLDLVYAAIDLIVAPDGEPFFVELNPSGHYEWIEHLTGLPISAEIAAFLSGEENRT